MVDQPFAHLAFTRVTSPIALVHLLFGPVEPNRTWKKDALGLFSEEVEIDRLVIGPALTNEGKMIFAVTRIKPTGHEPNTTESLTLPNSLESDIPSELEDSRTATITTSNGSSPALVKEIRRSPDTLSPMATAARNHSLTKVLLFASALVACTTGVSSTLLVYMFRSHGWQVDRSAVLTTATLPFVLTASQMLSTILSRSVPIVLTLYAYRLGADWLTASGGPDTTGRPTPLQ